MPEGFRQCEVTLPEDQEGPVPGHVEVGTGNPNRRSKSAKQVYECYYKATNNLGYGDSS